MLQRSDKDKITFKAIEKYRYGLRKTASKRPMCSRKVEHTSSILTALHLTRILAIYLTVHRSFVSALVKAYFFRTVLRSIA